MAGLGWSQETRESGELSRTTVQGFPTNSLRSHVAPEANLSC